MYVTVAADTGTVFCCESAAVWPLSHCTLSSPVSCPTYVDHLVSKHYPKQYVHLHEGYCISYDLILIIHPLYYTKEITPKNQKIMITTPMLSK